jgi:hypothetical protein
MAEERRAEPPPAALLDTIENLARFHREHEKYYSQAPLRSAADLQAISRTLKALAGHWSEAEPSDHPAASPYAGAEDLNAPGLVSGSGVLFMEGEGEPPEIAHMKRDLERVAADLDETGTWLISAMDQSWGVVGGLGAYPELAGVLGERHRIIANDWQSAQLQVLVARLLRRARELLERIAFDPASLRADLAGPRETVPYLYSASELIDRGADLVAESATLVHENERSWRRFAQRVREIKGGA